MKKLAFTLAFAAAAAVSAETKIATVNMVDLVRLHPTHESNKALVKSTDKEYKEKMDRQQQSVKAIADEGKKIQDDMMNPMLSATAKAEAQRKMEDVQKRFIAARQELEASARHFQNELADLEQRMLKLETDDIRAKIDAYAKANGYDLIADSTMLAFASPKLDVTDDILKAMNVDPAKRAKKETKDAKAK